jgi:hypothetical protein
LGLAKGRTAHVGGVLQHQIMEWSPHFIAT